MIEKLTLPSTTKGVKENALYGCSGLTDLYVKRALPPSAFSNTFEGVNLFACKLHVPYGSKQYYEKVTGWKDFYFIEEEAPISITVVKNIKNVGEIVGLNEYQPGDMAELTAIAHSGYTFSGWTENGQLLTTETTYTFTVTNSRQLVAVFVPVQNNNDVQAMPGASQVHFTWEAEEGADSYLLNVYADEGMTQLVGSCRLDSNGQPMQVLTKATGNTLTTTIEGLEAETAYYYSLTAYAEGDIVLSQYTGTFATSTSAISVTRESAIVCLGGNHRIRIANAEGMEVQVCDLQGRSVHQGWSDAPEISIPAQPGIYLVRTGRQVTKVVVF